MGSSLENMNLTEKDSYANFLAQTYYYVSHSTRFLAFSAGLMGDDDKKYFNRFIKHISEEHNHELLALRDLKNLGYAITDFPESMESKMLWETQYYKIQHEDPLSLIGYIIPLEMMSAKYFPDFLQRVTKAFGSKTNSFVRVHAEEDPDHIEEALAILNELSGKRKERVVTNIMQTAISYTNLINALPKKSFNELYFSPELQNAETIINL